MSGATHVSVIESRREARTNVSSSAVRCWHEGIFEPSGEQLTLGCLRTPPFAGFQRDLVADKLTAFKHTLMYCELGPSIHPGMI
jgi:hypothetical protein